MRAALLVAALYALGGLAAAGWILVHPDPDADPPTHPDETLHRRRPWWPAAFPLACTWVVSLPIWLWERHLVEVARREDAR